METLNSINYLLNEIIYKSYFNLRLFEYLIIFFAIFLSLIIRGFFSKFVIKRIKFFVEKTNNKIDDQIYISLSPPIKLIPIIFVLFFISLYFNPDSMINIYLIKINKTFFTIFVFWLTYTFINPLKLTFVKYEGVLSKALYQWIFKSIQYLIVFLSIVAVFEVWGIKIGPVIAGLGLFGVAIALGAQDLFKNLISGIMILLEKRFQIGDVISVPGHTSGTVEHIGFRSTLIREFDSTPISMPNYIFAEKPILNFSNRFFRRINWSIGLIYNTSSKQLKDITNDILNFIKSSENFIVNEEFKSYVYIEKFNESSIDILVCVFTNTKDWENFLKIKEELSLEIKKIVKKYGSDFAFPTRTIFIEKNLSE